MDNSRVKATIFFIEKISFSLKLFSGHFNGQSFTKTVQGPCFFFPEYSKIKEEKQASRQDCVIENNHSDFSTKTYAVGTLNMF